jgi:hypothetical protein
VIDNDVTFASRDGAIHESQWQAAIAHLDNILSQWRKALEECTEEKLNEDILVHRGGSYVLPHFTQCLPHRTNCLCQKATGSLGQRNGDLSWHVFNLKRCN